ncbi:hypothetical protein [Methanosarcina sp. DH1]|nr:hypothetical protein [Methanosarcina sp. DH1]
MSTEETIKYVERIVVIGVLIYFGPWCSTSYLLLSCRYPAAAR